MQEAENDNLTIVDNASPNEWGASPTVENETYKEIDMDSAKLIDGLEYENSEAKNNENWLTHKIVLSCIGIWIFWWIYIFLNSSMVILYDNYLSTISCIFLVFYWFYFLYILRTIFQHSWIKLLFLGILTWIFLINYLTKKWYFESHLAEAILYSTVIIPLLSFWISELKKNFICIYVRLILGLCWIAGFALATLWILTYDWRSYNTDLIFSTFITFFLFFLVFWWIILRKYYQTNINVKPGIECQIIWSKDFLKRYFWPFFLFSPQRYSFIS